MTHHTVRSFAELHPGLFDTSSPVLPAGPSTDLGFIREGYASFSPRQAQIVLDRCRYAGQRELDKNHIVVLTDLMEQGRWQPRSTIDFAQLGGTLILVNGYHRLRSQMASGRTIEWNVAFHPCASMDEVGMTYMRFDTNTRMRTPKQLLAATGYAENHGLDLKVAEGLYRAVLIIDADFPAHIRDLDLLASRVVDRRLELAEPYVKAAQLYSECIKTARYDVARKLLRATTMAVALVTLAHQPEQAKLFWRGAATNDMLAARDPRQALFLYLAKSETNRRHGTMLGQLMGPPAICWNAFYEHRQIAYIKVPSDWYLHIAGTPWAYRKPADREEDA